MDLVGARRQGGQRLRPAPVGCATGRSGAPRGAPSCAAHGHCAAAARRTSASSAAVSGTMRLAASVGVAARRSATRSHSGLSGSWPIALTTGVVHAEDRPAQRLVGERQQVLDAAAAARDDDHVDGGVGVEFAQRLDDLRHRVGALHRGVANGETALRAIGLWPPRRRRARRRYARPVISPMVLGRNGMGRFSRGSNRPSASSSLRSRSMRASSSPTPTARISVDAQRERAATGEEVGPAAA